MTKPSIQVADARTYWPVLYWVIHTLMLALFLLLESVGFRMPVGSSLFWFGWLALWMTHGLTLLLGRAREREGEADPEGAKSRFRRRMGLGVHTAVFLAFGPAVMLWWLVTRQPGPQQPGEGQGLWIYPLWLLLLLAHSAFVVTHERRVIPAEKATKRKHDRLYRLSDDGELEEDDGDDWQTAPELEQSKRYE